MKNNFILIGLASASLLEGVTLSEATVGDFSDDFANPTQFDLAPGVNILEFTIGGGPVTGGGATDGSDADFVTFLLGSGETLTSLVATASVSTPANIFSSHFFGAQFGTAFSAQPVNDLSFADELDFQNLFDDFIFANLLRRDFPTPPIQPTETFTGWFQETSDTSFNIRLEATVIPEPSVPLLCALGLSFLARRKRR